MNVRIVAAVLLVLAAASSAGLAAEGWHMPQLNPFAKKAGPPTSARVSDQDGGWKMPKMWPSSTKTSGKTIVKKPAAPSTWQKMKSGTKSLVNKTADVLNPFDDAKDTQPPPQVTGSNSYFSQVANQKPAEKKSSTILPSWWSASKKEEKPKTVNDFLSQQRPGY